MKIIAVGLMTERLEGVSSEVFPLSVDCDYTEAECQELQ